MEDLAPDFERLLTGALPPGPNYFLHRDFQSRNLLIKTAASGSSTSRGGVWGPWATTWRPCSSILTST